VYNKPAKNQEKIQSLSHRNENLCLQGKRDLVAGKVRNAYQTYIGGGPWLARQAHGQGICCSDGARPWVFQGIPTRNLIAPRIKFHQISKISSSNRTFLIEKFKIWRDFVCPCCMLGASMQHGRPVAWHGRSRRRGIGVAIEVCPQNPIKFWHSNHRIVLWWEKKIR